MKRRSKTKPRSRQERRLIVERMHERQVERRRDAEARRRRIERERLEDALRSRPQRAARTAVLTQVNREYRKRKAQTARVAKIATIAKTMRATQPQAKKPKSAVEAVARYEETAWKRQKERSKSTAEFLRAQIRERCARERARLARKRAQRREVLSAKGRLGGGNRKPQEPKETSWYKVNCRKV